MRDRVVLLRDATLGIVGGNLGETSIYHADKPLVARPVQEAVERLSASRFPAPKQADTILGEVFVDFDLLGTAFFSRDYVVRHYEAVPVCPLVENVLDRAVNRRIHLL